MITLEKNAHAKINLGLDILHRRLDGYHEVYMVMQSIALYDTLSVTKKNTTGISLSCNHDNLSIGEDNLILKAARLFCDTMKISEGVHITLTKQIPIAAGMAGGSSDAATTLLLLNELFETNLTTKQLMELGLRLGADVPFCILGGTALAEGIGEKLSPLPSIPDCNILLIKPPIGVSTKYVYENLNVHTITHHPDMNSVIEGLKESNLEHICMSCENILENVTIKAHPVIQEIKDFMKHQGAMLSLMSGSGPTVFGIYKEDVLAQEAYETAKRTYPDYEIFLTRPKFEKK